MINLVNLMHSAEELHVGIIFTYSTYTQACTYMGLQTCKPDHEVSLPVGEDCAVNRPKTVLSGRIGPGAFSILSSRPPLKPATLGHTIGAEGPADPVAPLLGRVLIGFLAKVPEEEGVREEAVGRPPRASRVAYS